MRIISSMLAMGLCLGACNKIMPIGNDTSVETNLATIEPLTPGEKPVRIGESGLGMSACVGRGTVVNLPPGRMLSVRDAPFGSAAEKDVLATGRHMAVCTRSMDQRWLGVVVAPDGGTITDCGVDAPVNEARDYDGECLSGWVTNAFVRITAQ